MNKGNIRRTIALLEVSETYDQVVWVTSCGTPSCIAGHTIVACGGKLERGDVCDRVAVIDGVKRDIPSAARELLGLEFSPACNLFQGYPFTGQGAGPATKEDAIATLERLLETGKVWWVRAAEAKQSSTQHPSQGE